MLQTIIYYLCRFWAGPIVTLIAIYNIAKWTREKTVNGVEQFVGLCGHLFFLVSKSFHTFQIIFLLLNCCNPTMPASLLLLCCGRFTNLPFLFSNCLFLPLHKDSKMIHSYSLIRISLFSLPSMEISKFIIYLIGENFLVIFLLVEIKKIYHLFFYVLVKISKITIFFSSVDSSQFIFFCFCSLLRFPFFPSLLVKWRFPNFYQSPSPPSR